MNDIIFKSVLYGSNKELTRWFTSKLFDTQIKNIKMMNSELPLENITDKRRHVDECVEIDEKIICDIEVNNGYKEYIHARNFGYITYIYNKFVRKNACYDMNHYYYLIDITKGIKTKSEKETIEFYLKYRNEIKYLQNFVICEINVDKVMEHWYNKDELINKYAHIIMLNLNKKDLKELVKYLNEENKRYVNEYRKEIEKFMKESENWYEPLFTWEEDRIARMNTEISIAKREAREQALKEGHAEGIEQGIEQNQENTIRNMAKDKLSVEAIAKYVGLPITKVNRILSNINL